MHNMQVLCPYYVKDQVLKDLIFPECIIPAKMSIVSLLCKRPLEGNVAWTDVWSYHSSLSSVNRFYID